MRKQNISSRFNNFYHGPILTEMFERCGTLRFSEWVDYNTGGPFEFIKGKDFSDMDELKQLLKNMNLDYEVDGDKKISTSDIDSKALVQHIDWCIKLAGQNNITFKHVEQEWDRLMESAGIAR